MLSVAYGSKKEIQVYNMGSQLMIFQMRKLIG